MNYETAPATAMPDGTPLPPGGGKRVLVVDDEPNIRRLIQIHLERHGYAVETARNGAEALRRIHESCPDLVVTDVMMPEMDGHELVAHIRRTPELKDLPVIVLTADLPAFIRRLARP